MHPCEPSCVVNFLKKVRWASQPAGCFYYEINRTLPGTNIAGYKHCRVRCQPPAADKTMTPWTTCKEQGGTRDKFPAPAPPAHATRRPLRSPHANPPPPPAHPLHPASSTTPSSRLPPWAGTTQRSRSSGEACAARLAVREPSGSIVQGVRAPPSPAPPGRATAPVKQIRFTTTPVGSSRALSCDPDSHRQSGDKIDHA
jgi:hypothetical protein